MQCMIKLLTRTLYNDKIFWKELLADDRRIFMQIFAETRFKKIICVNLRIFSANICEKYFCRVPTPGLFKSVQNVVYLFTKLKLCFKSIVLFLTDYINYH